MISCREFTPVIVIILVFVGEKDGQVLRRKGYEYHTVFCDNHYIYDPILSKNPIPRGDFQSIINKLNPSGVIVREGSPWDSVKVRRRGAFVNKVGKI